MGKKARHTQKRHPDTVMWGSRSGSFVGFVNTETVSTPDHGDLPPALPDHVAPAGLTVTGQWEPIYRDRALQAELAADPVRRVAVDVETTGLDPDRHQVCEVAWVCLNTGEAGHFIPPHSLHDADPVWLTLNGYHDRIAGQSPSPRDTAAFYEFIHCDRDAILLIGSNPQFDVAMLTAMYSAEAARDRLDVLGIDVGVMSYALSPDAALGGRDRLADAAGKLSIPLQHHSAASDAAAAADIWFALEQRRRRMAEIPF